MEIHTFTLYICEWGHQNMFIIALFTISWWVNESVLKGLITPVQAEMIVISIVMKNPADDPKTV